MILLKKHFAHPVLTVLIVAMLITYVGHGDHDALVDLLKCLFVHEHFFYYCWY